MLNGNIFLKKDRQNSEKNLYANFLTEFKKSFEFDEHFGYYFLMFLMFEKKRQKLSKISPKNHKKVSKNIFKEIYLYRIYHQKIEKSSAKKISRKI